MMHMNCAQKNRQFLSSGKFKRYNLSLKTKVIVMKITQQ